MKAFELKPGQFFEWEGMRCLCAWHDKLHVWFATEDNTILDAITHDTEVTPLDVQGWDDEAKVAIQCLGELHKTVSDDAKLASEIASSRVLPPAPLQLRESPAVQGEWTADCLQRAFVEGAKWWEYESQSATMWQSDRNLAEQEAVRRYGPAPIAEVPPPVPFDDPSETWTAEKSELRKACKEWLEDTEVPPPVEPPQPSVDVGEGWRLLETGEVIEEGDEVLRSYGFDTAHNIGLAADKHGTYRRKVPPEQFKAGDLVVCDSEQVGAAEFVEAGTCCKVADVYDVTISLEGYREHYFADNFRRATPAEIAAHKEAAFQDMLNEVQAVSDANERREIAAAKPQPDADGWIEHDGPWLGDPNAVVDVKRKNGKVRLGTIAKHEWWRTECEGKVTHYRLVEPAKPAPLDWVEVVTR